MQLFQSKGNILNPLEGGQKINLCGPISLAFNVVIVFFQLAMTWGKKA